MSINPPAARGGAREHVAGHIGGVHGVRDAGAVEGTGAGAGGGGAVDEDGEASPFLARGARWPGVRARNGENAAHRVVGSGYRGGDRRIVEELRAREHGRVARVAVIVSIHCIPARAVVGELVVVVEPTAPACCNRIEARCVGAVAGNDRAVGSHHDHVHNLAGDETATCDLYSVEAAVRWLVGGNLRVTYAQDKANSKKDSQGQSAKRKDGNQRLPADDRETQDFSSAARARRDGPVLPLCGTIGVQGWISPPPPVRRSRAKCTSPPLWAGSARAELYVPSSAGAHAITP